MLETCSVSNAVVASSASGSVGNVNTVASPGGAPESLPLILARELASNLATPMFLIDATGTLVFYNDAAELLIGKPFAKLGEIDALEFGAVLKMSDPDGSPLRRRDSPAGIAFSHRRPAHRTVVATGYDGVRRTVDATAFPLFGAAEELHGVVAVFWERPAPDDRA